MSYSLNPYLLYSINHNVFKIKVKCSFLILSKKRVLLFFWRSLDLEKALLGRVGIGVGATACETSTRIEATVRLFLLPFRPGGGRSNYSRSAFIRSLRERLANTSNLVIYSHKAVEILPTRS